MTSALQNRLVGTIIVVALIVIFVPEFLDGEKRTSSQDFVSVPPVAKLVEVEKTDDFDAARLDANLPPEAPLSTEQAIDAPQSAEATVDDSSVVDKPAQAVSQEADVTEQVNISKTPAKPPVQQVQQEAQAPVQSAIEQSNDVLSQIDVKDAGWVVQLGVFSNQKNVRALLNTLNDAGYRTYTRPVTTAAGTLTKVFVGPELEKETLEQALSHLQEITQLKGKITPFEVSAE